MEFIFVAVEHTLGARFPNNSSFGKQNIKLYSLILKK